MTPEQDARRVIDQLLTAAGWVIQDRSQQNLGAGLGVAVREFPMRTGEADYLLFVDRQAVGAIEAKPAGVTLSGTNLQTQKYSDGLRPGLPACRVPLPFLYESTGVETFFTNLMDPEPRSRAVFAFHRPETLLTWVQAGDTLRGRLRLLPPLITSGLWAHQIETISNLEKSLAQDKPRALIQMTMGSGKTFTSVSAIYRLLKFGKAKRVLFLVDRTNLGTQALAEFRNYTTPDTKAKFGEIYNVQLLDSNRIDPVCKVVITTIQRLYSILRGEDSFNADEEALPNAYDSGEQRTVGYNPQVPIEEFDFVFIDECHRSIYKLWRQVLEYFDAHLIGLTATPSKLTMGFFNKNLVMEYDRKRAVADGVNVDGQVYRIRTQITEGGGTVPSGFVVGKMDKRTRAKRWEALDDDFTYDAPQLDRAVVAEDQIRTVLRHYRDEVCTTIFPGRKEMPKTLIFAKDDNHAENIVRMLREEFGKGNDFCQKITYRVSGVSPQDLIRQFRQDARFRIAVTVDLVATGADIRPLEVVFFMRMVRSPQLFEQMLGRATRVITSTDLVAVTPSARYKDRFVIVDAVGVTEQEFEEIAAPLDREPVLSIDNLLQCMANGIVDEEIVSSLAARLLRLAPKLDEPTIEQIATLSGGKTVRQIATDLLFSIDPDAVEQEATARNGGNALGDSDSDNALRTEITTQRMRRAAQNFDSPLLRQTLLDANTRNEITIDVTTEDVILEYGFTEDGAQQTVADFRAYLHEHSDEIDALQILFARPYAQRRLTRAAIKELSDRLRLPPHSWTTEQLWRAFARLEADKVRDANSIRRLTDLVSLVRHALNLEAELEPFPDVVRRRYTVWLAEQEAAGKTFSEAQRWWLDRIAEQIGVDLEVTLESLNQHPFADRGGVYGAMDILGGNWRQVVDELSRALVPIGSKDVP